MNGNKFFKNKDAKKKIAASLFVLSSSLGAMFVADRMNIDAIVDEYSVISEMANKTLNISFVPNNPYMKDNVKLFNPITQNDIDNIAKIQGVKSVKPIDTEYNPLSGYLKVDSKSSYIELYGMNESGEDSNKNNIEMVYGRAINSGDRGKNVIVLNMETVNALQVADAKSLIGTGVEINNAIYEVIGIMNVVMADERDNVSELEGSSLIPKSTSKEILARANATNSSYSAITVSVEDGANSNAVETSIYNLLYQKHEGINGYYERDVEYNLPKKLDPALTMLDNFVKYLKASSFGMALISLFALLKSFRKTKDEYEQELEAELELDLESNNNEAEVESDNLESSDKVVSENDNEDEVNEDEVNEDEVNEDEVNEDEVNEDKVNETEANSEANARIEEGNAQKEMNEDTKEESELGAINSTEDEIESMETPKKKSSFLESNKDNMLIVIIALALSLIFNNYYLSGKNITNLFDISIVIKSIIVFVSIYLIKISEK